MDFTKDGWTVSTIDKAGNQFQTQLSSANRSRLHYEAKIGEFAGKWVLVNSETALEELLHSDAGPAWKYNGGTIEQWFWMGNEVSHSKWVELVGQKKENANSEEPGDSNLSTGLAVASLLFVGIAGIISKKAEKSKVNVVAVETVGIEY